MPASVICLVAYYSQTNGVYTSLYCIRMPYSTDWYVLAQSGMVQEGPIHDVQWNPKGDYFLVVAGFMPAKVTLFTDKCQAHYDLGEKERSLNISM